MSGSEPLYLSLGVSLLGMSFLSMSIIFGDDETKQFINMQIDLARWHATILLIITFYMYLVGMLHSFARTQISLELVILGVTIVWIGFFVIELSSLIKLHQAGFRPKSSKTLFDIAVYLAVFWLIMERVDLHLTVLQIFTTIFIICTLYFVVMLKKYRRMVTILVEPMDLYVPAVGLRLISAIAGLSFITYGYSESAFKGLIALGYLVLAVIFWHSAMDMQRIFMKGKGI
jgi:hypothetical protein